ncbi:hypothetical protein BOTCAL_0284g00060 [Botryotinia calthae]|uniref:CFEM domain-containing protein n=1 Tax=Botryotinia calthae TaxID=38488 RepID=A0A4Y8CXR5_9HELO|nr:hypothetical protein BOTCAL_0284g00060 [Botryotinia calthae]
MRVFAWLSLLCAVLPVNFVAASLSMTDVVEALPSCALTCLTTALANSTCSPTDQECICTNVPLNAEVNTCVMGQCTIKEALSTKNITSVACDAPVRDKRNLYNWISNSFVIAAWIAYLLRIASRFTSDTQLWWDDYVATFVMIVGIPQAVINVRGLTGNGLGKDIWTLDFKNISDMIRWFYAAEILYFAQVNLIKVSILFFFLRLFPERKIRLTIWGTIIANLLIFIIIDLLAALQCRPISFYWKRWDGEHSGKCLNINALAFSSAGVSIVMDIWMLILPLTQLYDLNLHWKKKIGVAAMLSIGIIVTVISILRLQSLIVFANTQNPTWDYVQLGYWCTVEICTAIICSSMPAIRLLLVRLFPRIAGTTQNSSNHSKSGGYDPSQRRSSVPKRASKNTYIPGRRGSHTTNQGITMMKTFDVTSSHRGMAFDKEIEEEDATELVSRQATRSEAGTGDVERGLENTQSYESREDGEHLSPPHEQNSSRLSSSRSINDGLVMSPRSPGWV